MSVTRSTGWSGIVGLALAVAACDSGSSTGGHDLSASVDMAVGDARSRNDDAAVTVTVDSGVSGVYHYQGTTPQVGVTFTFTLDHSASTIVATNTDPGTAFTLSGTFESLASGFLKTSFTAGCDGVGCTPSASNVVTTFGSTITFPENGHALEAPGYLLVLDLDDANVQLAAVGSDSCSPGMFATYNAVDIVPSDENALELATLSGSAAAVTASGDSYALDTDGGMSFNQTGPCSGGVITFQSGAADGGVSVFESGSSGVIFVSNPSGNSNTAQLALKRSAITLTDLENHTYSAFTFQPMSTVAQYGTLTLGSAPSGQGKLFLDPDSNSVDPNGNNWAIINFDTVVNGLLTGVQTSGNQTAALEGAVLQAGGVNILIFNVGVPGGQVSATTVAISH